ncbi:hypothetical protein DXG01_013238 [Tephrocybe rancida]|nr:hypothetical protein DXG01_013238 [Tephrocybe rancida]
MPRNEEPPDPGTSPSTSLDPRTPARTLELAQRQQEEFRDGEDESELEANTGTGEEDNEGYEEEMLLVHMDDHGVYASTLMAIPITDTVKISPELDSADLKIVELFTKVGENTCSSGPLPKVAKVFPRSPAGRAASRHPARPLAPSRHQHHLTNTQPKQAECFFRHVLLPAVRQNITTNATAFIYGLRSVDGFCV